MAEPTVEVQRLAAEVDCPIEQESRPREFAVLPRAHHLGIDDPQQWLDLCA